MKTNPPSNPPSAFTTASASIVHDQSEFNVLFVHSKLDDYGLNAAQFRVYCHLARRASGGSAWPSAESVAKVCKLNPKTVYGVLKFLIGAGLVVAQKRPGQTTVYTLTKPSSWRSPALSDDNLTQKDTQVSKRVNTSPNRIPTKDIREGNPVPPLIPLQGDCVSVASGKNSEASEKAHAEWTQADQVYEAYPRKVGKPAALRKIAKAIRQHGFELVLQKTKLFAATCNAPPEFIPHPSTWFNQERFLDNPATWRRNDSGNGSNRSDLRQLELQADALQERIDRHEANPESACHRTNCSDEAKEDLRRLRSELQSVKADLCFRSIEAQLPRDRFARRKEIESKLNDVRAEAQWQDDPKRRLELEMEYQALERFSEQ